MKSGTTLGVLVTVAGLLLVTSGPATPAAALAGQRAGASPPARHALAAIDGKKNRFGIRLTEVSESLREDPRARQYIIDHLNPGTVLRRQVEVYNEAGTALSVSLYPAAATINDGGFHFADGHGRNELTTWTSVDPATVELAPHARRTAEVIINVPKDASPGEHYGVIWAEAAGDPAGGGVRMVNRVGVRMYLDIGPGGPPAAGFTIASLTASRLEDGRTALLTDVRNTGGRALDMSGDVHLDKGPGGLRAGPFRAALGTTIAPGGTSPVSIPLDGTLPLGPWSATVTLRSGLVEHSVTTTVEFPRRPGSHRYLITGYSTGWYALAAGIGAVGVLTVILIVGARHRRRRRAGATIPGPGADPTPST